MLWRMVTGKRSVSVYLIEAQTLFVPTLVDVFEEAGFEFRGSSVDTSVRQLLNEPPDIVFVDIDFVSQDPLRLISLLRTLLPETVIYVYTSQTNPDWAAACHGAGASGISSKNASRQEIVAGMRTSLEKGTYTDPRMMIKMSLRN